MQSKKALALLTTVNYLNYIDRYILAAVLISIKAELHLSDFEAGLLATAFIVPYMLTSPIFGWIGDKKSRSKILSLGVAVWSFASLMTGAAGSFLIMLASRFLLGIGESAFTVISVPFISDHFDKKEQGKKLAIFSTALPVGAALGYVVGGLVSSQWGWRTAFYGAGLPGLVLALTIWRLPDPRKQQTQAAIPFLPTVKRLFRSKAYTFAVLGYCAYTFVVGGVAYWVPAFMQRQFSLAEANANTLFGGIAVVSGLLGTLVGGTLDDRLQLKKSQGHLRVCAYSMFAAFPFFLLCVQSTNVPMFLVFLAVAEFLFFVSTSPINVALLGAAPAELATSAMALAIFACHILGDAISAPLIGLISDKSQSLSLGLLCCAPMILLCAGFWLIGTKENA